MGGGRSSLDHELASIPVRVTLPWWHGEQEKGTRIPSPVGTRRRRGSNGRASAKGGRGGASSTRRYSRCESEGRRRAMSMVWRGGDGGAFYRGGEGRRSARRRWCAIKRRPVME
jgi:hypothetical protein